MEKIHSITFFNEIVSNQDALTALNAQRPPIYLYTDFGGGHSSGDLQTSGELASAAWKTTLQKTLWINDQAIPLNPFKAAQALAATFPYQSTPCKKGILPEIKTIVVHVIDPGVGNNDTNGHAHPRSLVLRKDGILFIGPDNGTLSFVCPADSIAEIWEITIDTVSALSGIDLQAGGTFHGRDLFCEAACRIAAGLQDCDDLGECYSTHDLKNRFVSETQSASLPLIFEKVTTDRFELHASSYNDTLFEQAFLLGIVQSPTYGSAHITQSKKLFFLHSLSTHISDLIAIVNTTTGNIFIGPNNGSGTSFFQRYPEGSSQFFTLTPEIFSILNNTKNNEEVLDLIKSQPSFKENLKEVSFLGNEKSLTYDTQNRPHTLHARIWIDAYGNIKTTAQSSLFNTIKSEICTVRAELNGIQHSIVFANTFSEVPPNTLFLYNGSSAVIGDNPSRSNRYVEISANGTFGTFGIDFFKNRNRKPQNGQEIIFSFVYED